MIYMITEDYVSFETAKLLKEKGFDIQSYALIKVFGGNTYEVNGEWITPKEDTIIPTLQMVMKWLREKCIFITLNIISFNLNDSPVWSFDIWHNNNHEYRSSDYFDSYEKTCEAAIKYYLKNLI